MKMEMSRKAEYLALEWRKRDAMLRDLLSSESSSEEEEEERERKKKEEDTVKKERDDKEKRKEKEVLSWKKDVTVEDLEEGSYDEEDKNTHRTVRKGIKIQISGRNPS
jgi:FKBP-type peptidyl-prolyl cis-trans isomerase